MSQVSNIDRSASTDELNPIPGSSHENSVPLEYEIIDLGSLGENSYAIDINDNGMVIGGYSISGEFRSFVWDKENGMRDIGTNGGKRVIANAINNAGKVVGYTIDASGYQQAFIWDEVSDIREIGTLGGRFSEALDINENGVIVGISELSSDPGSERHAFIWNETDGFTDLGTLPNSFGSQAFGVNNKGVVVGWNTTDDGRGLPFIWSNSGGMQSLPTLTTNLSMAFSINDNKMAVGFSNDSDDMNQPAIWDENGQLIDITESKITRGNSRDINNSDIVVGYATFSQSDLVGEGFIWKEGDGLKRLGAIAGAGSQAVAINEVGQIVGSSTIDDNNQVAHAVLWNPISYSDTTPPEISYEQVNTSLWPPNHKMRKLLAGISVSDDTDENPSLEIHVESNKAVNGIGDGNTDQDWEIVQAGDGSYDLYLRAERNGPGTGRMYTITLTSEDEAGNISEKEITVSVPHDMGLD